MKSPQSEFLPAQDELESVFRLKHGPEGTWGWSPRRRLRFRYFSPSDVYEAVVGRLVTSETAWLDVGGGKTVFPENPRLARQLAERAQRLVAVDPSENVHRNEIAHERIQSLLEDFKSVPSRFDLATARMVAEHVESPQAFVSALAHLVKPGGLAVVLTVNKWSPITLVSALVPFKLHHAVKQRLWGGKEEDTFPVRYLLNTHRDLREAFDRAGFDEVLYTKLDDLSAFGWFRVLNLVELGVWRVLRSLGLSYPENCLLAIYRRREGERPTRSRA